VQPRVARQMYGGLSLDNLYNKIKSGEIDSYLDGRRRLITVASIEADVARNVAAAAASGFQRDRYPLRQSKQVPARHYRRGRRSRATAKEANP
jgi:hypothetical protein